MINNSKVGATINATIIIKYLSYRYFYDKTYIYVSCDVYGAATNSYSFGQVPVEEELIESPDLYKKCCKCHHKS